LNTGIYIRARVAGKYESIDIGDDRLPAPELLRWLTSLPDDAILRTIDRAKLAAEASEPQRMK
jgi:hypothetical protein